MECGERQSTILNLFLSRLGAKAMCGIVALIKDGRPQAELAADLHRMAQTLVHRGPNDQGIHAVDGAGIGMRRLSIIDVDGGQQPIGNETNDVHVVCNGEIYNFAELRKSLEQKGHRFSTRSDAEVVVHLYEEYGQKCFEHLRGMFGIAIWDGRCKRLLLARDRLGKKPLFYAQTPDGVIAGSEIKAILAAAPELRQANPTVFAQYLQFGYIPEPQTAYRSVFRLPAGHFAVCEGGKLDLHRYWDLQFEADESLSVGEWQEQIDETLTQAVKLRLQSEVPLGIFLSGGLDSSAVAAYASRSGLKSIKTFTVGFDRPEWDESADAKLVADHLGCEHHVLPLCEQTMCGGFEQTLSDIVWHCDEPFGDASAIPTYHISKLASEHVTVILSGDGGDELFGGYTSYRGALFAQNYRTYLPAFAQNSLPSLVRSLGKVSPWKRYQIQRVAKVLEDSRLDLVPSYLRKVSIWNRSQLEDLLAPELLAGSDFAAEQQLISVLGNRQKDLVSRLSEADVKSYLLDDILVKVDRMSMAHSLEVRSPLLDHHVVELAARIPTRFKIRGGQGKDILRRVVDSQLPVRAIRKRKQGFSVPLRDWFRGRLRALVFDKLTSQNALPDGCFRQEHILETLEEHERGRVDHSNRIWQLLALNEWYQQNRQPEGASQGHAYVSTGPNSEAQPCAS